MLGARPEKRLFESEKTNKAGEKLKAEEEDGLVQNAPCRPMHDSLFALNRARIYTGGRTKNTEREQKERSWRHDITPMILCRRGISFEVEVRENGQQRGNERETQTKEEKRIEQQERPVATGQTSGTQWKNSATLRIRSLLYGPTYDIGDSREAHYWYWKQ